MTILGRLILEEHRVKSALVSRSLLRACRRSYLHKPWTKLMLVIDHIVTS